MSTSELLLLLVAGVAAGGVNAVAGGGSLVSFPALLAVGIPPLSANVTNSVAVWPGYVGTSWGYRVELRAQLKRLAGLAPAALLGAGAGCVLLLRTGEEDLRAGGAVPRHPRQPAARGAGPGHRAGPPLAWRRQRRAVTAAARLPRGGRGVRRVLRRRARRRAARLPGAVHHRRPAAAQRPEERACRSSSTSSRWSCSRSSVRWCGPPSPFVAPAALVGGYLGAHVARRLSASALRAVIVVFGIAVGIALL